MRASVVLVIIAGVLLLFVGGAVAWREVLWRSGWFRAGPEIARGMPGFSGAQFGPWTRRLNQRFPIGSAEVKMTEELRRQGFQVDVSNRRAAYGWAVYPCIYTLTVSWRADEQFRVRTLEGGLLDACTDPKFLLPDRPAPFGRPAGGPRPPSVADPQLVPSAKSA